MNLCFFLKEKAKKLNLDITDDILNFMLEIQNNNLEIVDSQRVKKK